MRKLNRRDALLGLAAASVAFPLMSTTPASAQAGIPNGVFVRESNGTTWLVLRGQRVGVPIWAATDAEIAALPASDQWGVLSINDDGAMVAGSRPAWLAAQEAASAVATPASPPGQAVGAPSSAIPQPSTAPPDPPAPGHSATFGAVTATILSAERGTRVVNSYYRPKPGMEYLAIEVRLDNPSATPVDYNGAQFKLVDADGGRWNQEAARDPVLGSGQILPRSSVRGWITFELRTGAAITLLIWQPRFDTTLPLALP